jgi:hypothetical protein
MTVNNKLSSKKILALLLFCLFSASALIYARILNPDLIPFITANDSEDGIKQWQEDAWKEYSQLSKRYQSPISLSGSLAITDSSSKFINQPAIPFQLTLNDKSLYYQLADWNVVQQDSILLMVDHIEKSMITQVLPADIQQRASQQIIPNVLGISASLIKSITGKIEDKGIRSITILLRQSEVEKIQLFYNSVSGFLTEATIWQYQLMGLSDQFQPEDSINSNSLRELEWDSGVDTDSSAGSLQAVFGKRITKILYQTPTSVDKNFRPLEKFVFFKGGKWHPTGDFQNYQFAIK